MRCWSYRNQLGRGVDSACATQRKNARKAFHKEPAELPRIEPHPPAAGLLSEYLARNYIAGRQLRLPMPLRHESHELFVEQHCSLATHRFRYQRQRILRSVQCGWMELHELHVSEPGSAAVRNRVAVARRDLRVRSVAVHLSAATRSKHGRVGDDLDRLSRHRRANSVTCPIVHDQLEDARLLENVDTLAVLHPLDQGARDFRAGLIAVRVYDPAPRMRRLTTELEIASRLEVEARSGGAELSHPGRTFFDENLDRCSITQRGTSRQRVLAMQLGGIARPEGGGDAALRICGRAVEERALRQHHDVATR